MRETEKRIRMYQAQLPFAKEKVIASLLIFAFSIAMITMTAFAWTTLSVAPEVSGATTTITSNGNLEIALAGNYDIQYAKDSNGKLIPQKEGGQQVLNTDSTTNQKQEMDGNTPVVDAEGNPVYLVQDENNNWIYKYKYIVEAIVPTPPNSSAVGDSLLSIQDRNKTWGNLINLSDPSYGLDQIILRPATLNTGVSLAKKPFVSATYGPDGRVESTTNSEFAYTQYLEIANGQYGFVQSDLPGVKAVSTVLKQPTHIDSKLGLYYDKMTTNVIPSVIFKTASDNLHSIVAELDMANGNSSPLSGLMSTYLNGYLYVTLPKTEPKDWVKPDGWKYDGYMPIACNRDNIVAIAGSKKNPTHDSIMEKLEDLVLDVVAEGYVELFYLYQMDTYIVRSEYDKLSDPENEFVWPESWARYDENEYGYVTKAGIDAFLADAPGLIDAMIAQRSKDSDKAILREFKTKITSFTTIRNTLRNAQSKLSEMVDRGDTIYWYEVEPYVNALVNIETTKIGVDGGEKKMLKTWFGSLKDNMTTLSKMLDKNANNSAVVEQGIIRDIDALLFSVEKGIYIQSVSVSVEYNAIKKRAGSYGSLLGFAGISGDQTIYANISTNAPTKDANNQWNACVVSDALIDITSVLDKGYIVYTYKALDTYGLAIDFWLRTNVPGASLILEGEVEFEDRAVTKTLANGTVVTLYLVDITKTITENDKEPEITDLSDVIIYSLPDENGNAVWYYEDGTLFLTEENIYGAIPEGATEAPIIGTIKTQMKSEPKVKTEKVAVGYSSANRVWKENEFPIGIDPQYSTTQGSGSCYTFYADPSELNTILSVLERMRVAFVDSNGKLLAIAKLDTKYCFSEYGRHLVPLVLYSGGGEVTVTDPISGMDTTYSTIMNMQTNTPTMISALVYLEGTSIENKDVLASADIQGQFNIQFGTVYDEKAMKDEALMNESITLAASIADKSVDAVKGEYVKTVTATISGLKYTTDEEGNKIWPSVTANFTRKISSTQGTIYFDRPLSFTTTDGTTWTCDFTFKTPGDYIMRSITIDGQEWFLNSDNPVEFSIDGFKIDNLSSEYGQKYTFMTAASYVSDQFTLNITASPAFANKMPQTIKGVFTNEDNVNVDLNFTKTSEANGTAEWVANVNFNTSGTYTLRYLLLDGEYYELPNPFIREVTLGLQTRVWLTAPNNFETDEEYKYNASQDVHSFFYMHPQTEHEFNVVLEIYDESGKEIRQLGGNDGVTLFYGEGDRQTAAKLKWNAVSDNYSGAALTLNFPGIYSFNRVEIPITTSTTTNTQSVTATRGASQVVIASRNPYDYTGIASVEHKEFNVLTSNITLATDAPHVVLNFENAVSATVYGKFVVTDKDGNEKFSFVVEAKRDDDTFVFFIPESVFGDGFYYLDTVKITNVLDKDDVFYQSNTNLVNPNNIRDTEAFDEANKTTNFLTVDFSAADKQNTKIKIIKNLFVSDNIGVENGANAVYGKDADGNVVGKFMQSYSVNDIKFTVVDFTGVPINDATVNAYYILLGNNSYTYGGYTYKDWDKDQKSTDLMGTVIGTTKSGSEYTVNSFNIATAGEYQIHATVVIGDQTVKEYTAKEVLQVWSAKPTVKVTNVSLGKDEAFNVNSHASAASGGGFTEMSGVKNYFTDYQATVYIQYTGAFDIGSGLAWRYYAEPSVELTLSGMTETFENAQLTFNHPTADYARTYTFTPGNGLVKTNEIGHADEPSLTDGNPKLYYAGKQTVNQITIKSGGVDYTVDLSHEVTINQPQYPAYADFKINDSTFTGTTPSRVYSQDGETITLTLPTIDSWFVSNETVNNQDFVTKSETARDVYKEVTTGSGCNKKTNYELYTEMTTVSVASSIKTTWTDTRTITGWKIGNKVYLPGETVELTGVQTITAVVTKVEGPKTAVDTTTTRTVISYTHTATQDTEPSGRSKVTNTEGSTTEVVS